MFNDFLTSLGQETSAVAVIISLFFCITNYVGLFTHSLFGRFQMRSIGVFGACLYFLGSFMTIFVTSVEHLVISFGVLQGAGFGFMIPVAYTSFNHYFVKKRVVMMNVAQSLTGILTALYPFVVQFLMKEYGFRGTVAIIAAINAHTIFGMLVMHPVEWHYKTVEIPLEEMDSCKQ